MPKIHPTITELQADFLKHPEKLVPQSMLKGLSQSEIIRRALDLFIVAEKKNHANDPKDDQ